MPESFTESVEAAVKVADKPVFDPESGGYDEATGAELAKKYPLTLPKPTDKPIGQKKVPARFNEGAFEAWQWHPEEKDWFKHKGSIDPRTGMLLKGMEHTSIKNAKDYEKSQGREFFKRDGRYYLQDIKK
jgi:hypothetical protein